MRILGELLEARAMPVRLDSAPAAQVEPASGTSRDPRDLRWTHLCGWNRPNADLRGHRLRHATLVACQLSWINGQGLDFRDAALFNVDFTGASLVGAHFGGAQLRCVNFNGADLQDTCFAAVDADEDTRLVIAAKTAAARPRAMEVSMLLWGLFSQRELTDFLGESSETSEIVRRLPTPISDADCAEFVADALIRRGLANPRLFRRLRVARPGRIAEIDAAERRLRG